MCPYAFLLNYIKPHPHRRQFFSDYGSFVHEIIAKYLTGELQRGELAAEYMSEFLNQVKGVAPNPKIFKSYFEQGYNYLTSIDFPYKNPLAVETKYEFYIDGKPFVGIVDCVAEDDGELVILDNKSRALSHRSKRAKPTQADNELDHYLRQLYLYSIPIREQYGKYPERLEFNCFRVGKHISEKFKPERFEEVKQWALNLISQIEDNDDWRPHVEFWQCRYICDLGDSCEYYQMTK